MMRHVALAFSLTLLSAVALQAQTPAAPPPTRARTTVRARPTSDTANSPEARFAAIRNRYTKELNTERAAVQRTRDRMREELVAAGWHPRRANGFMRSRLAAFRGRSGRAGRGAGRMMMRRPMMGRPGMGRPGMFGGGRGMAGGMPAPGAAMGRPGMMGRGGRPGGMMARRPMNRPQPDSAGARAPRDTTGAQ